MLEVNERIAIPEGELTWSFVRSGGPDLARELEAAGYAAMTEAA